MEMQITTAYVICEEVLKALGIRDDRQSRMTNAEVMTFSIISSRLFGGNHFRTRWFCIQARYFPNILSNSRLNRRVHKVPWSAWMAVFHFLAAIFHRENESTEFAVDSFPVSSCAKSRIDRRRFFHGKEYVGYAASKKKYFCGLKVHMLVTLRGGPVEVALRPASENDLNVLWGLNVDLPSRSVLYADGAYNSFELEDILREDEGVVLKAKRGSRNSSRPRDPLEERQISSRRQIVETAFSCITGLLPRYIRASTERGFLIRVLGAILAYGITLLP